MKKDQFLKALAGMSKEDINQVIKEKGKPPKLFKPCVYVGPIKKEGK